MPRKWHDDDKSTVKDVEKISRWGPIIVAAIIVIVVGFLGHLAGVW